MKFDNASFGSAGLFGSQIAKYPMLAPEGDAPAGGGGTTTVQDPPAGDPADKKFVDQDALNAAVKAARKDAEAKTKATEQKLASMEAKLEALLAKLTPETPEDKTVEGKLEAAQKRHQRELEETNKKIAEVEARYQQAEARRLETLRDRALDEALVQAGCTDLKMGRRFFLPDITNQDEDGQPLEDWVLKSPSGKLVDIPTGVNEVLPAYLRNPRSNVGGAGTTSGGTKNKDKDKVAALETEVKALMDKAKSEGPRNGQTLVQYRLKKQELDRLKATITTK